MSKAIFQQERQMLRDELHHLRVCQITFLTSAVTATGAILGFGTSLSSEMSAFVGLFPPLILIPAWWVFFDKATTITRIVGYSRVLEQLVLGQQVAGNFVGWENALRTFRDAQIRGHLEHSSFTGMRDLLGKLWRLLRFKTGHRYWLIANIVFATLSACSLSLPMITRSYALATKTNTIQVPISILLPLWLIFTATLFAQCLIIWSLIHGRHSYDANEKFWKTILQLRRAEGGGTVTAANHGRVSNGSHPARRRAMR